ncbi:MAG: S-4TM family putative pore-forming effector [Butyrivibrio sp.]|nr:S-4TM family putative pore-forming effector [Butyrivibrio sp.]
MHKILNRTHKKRNIDILKARDYYFDKVRLSNNVFRKLCLLAPIGLSVILMIFGTVVDVHEKDDWLDIIVGITAVVAFVIDLFIQKSMSENLEKSNILREEYDCKVLGIKRNLFLGRHSKSEMDELISMSEYVKDGSKYEVWYRETFSDDDTANAICLAMDNTIYSFHAYRSYKSQLVGKMVFLVCVFLLYTAWYQFTPDDYFVAMVNPFVLFIAMFDAVKELISSILVSSEQVKSTENVINYIEKNKSEILSDYEGHETILRSLEDIVYYNRVNSLILPKRTRKKFLSNGNEYYKDLDKIKNKYWEGKTVYKPELPKDYEIPAAATGIDGVDDSYVVNMEAIHDELLVMLKDTKKVLDKCNISILLDGGTLLGAARNNKYLPWDDDVDIAIKTKDVDRVIEELSKDEEFLKKYEIQDYYTEKYYSPRLSRLRIRQKNDHSFIDEKDSELFELYEKRGLFLDIYAYSPVLVNVVIDYLYRLFFICPIHKRIRKTETNWKIKPSKEKYLARFEKQKKVYMDRSDWYKKHAKCEKYYAYEPHYLEFGWMLRGRVGKLIKKIDVLKDFLASLPIPGVYIKGKDLFGEPGQEKQYMQFEDAMYEVPSNVDSVLSIYYGEDWMQSPYKKLDELPIDNNGIQYSMDRFDATRYKHAKAVYIKDRIEKLAEE